jgi:cytochrome c2
MIFRLFRRINSGSPLGIGMVWGAATFLLFAPRSASAQEATEPAQDPLAGSEVFTSKGCIECHAVNGIGGNVGPDLAYIPRRRSFYELASTLWNHVPIMGEGMEKHGIEDPEMDAHDAADLIGFLFTLDYFDPPGDVEAGKHLFTEKSCIVCHRVGSYGGEVGPSLDFVGRYGSPILVAAAMWNHGAAMADSMKAKGVERPTFEGTELVDLIAFLESAAPQPVEGRVYVLPGRAEAGRVVFVEKRCRDCHSVQGVGGRIGPDLAAMGRRWSLTEFAAAMWNKAPAMMEAQKAKGIRTPSLGAVEMADLVAYLYAIEYFAEVGDPEMGEQHLTDSGCLGCHSIGGTGGNIAKDFYLMRELVSPAEVSAALWNHSILIGSGAEVMQGPWPKLSPGELADIMAYLQTPPPDR